MFGSKKETPQVVGAREKIRRAEALKHGSMGGIQANTGKKQDITAAVILIFGMAMALALLLTQGPLSKGNFSIRGLPSEVNRLLFSSNPPAFIGDKDMDLIAAVAVRGFALFLLAGVLPFLCRLWNKMRNNIHANPYVVFWGMMVGVPFVFFFIKDFFGPLIIEVVGLFIM